MPNIAKVLKEEIRRLAKKEAKALTAKIKADVVRLKKSDIATRRMIKQLRRDNELLLAAESRRQRNAPVLAPGNAGKARLTARGVRAMRKKLGLSLVEFGRLAGVSMGAVRLWERKAGGLRLRDTTRAAILSLRGIGAREAKRRLELLADKGRGKPGAGKAKGRRR